MDDSLCRVDSDAVQQLMMETAVRLSLEYYSAVQALTPEDRNRLTSRFPVGVNQVVSVELLGGDSDLAGVCEQLFGDRNVTPARTRIYNAMRTLGQIDQMGWTGPRREANNGVDTLETTKDYHVWLVDLENDGAVVDYPDDQLARGSEFWTNRIVRRAWSNELADAIRPRLEREAQIWIRRHLDNYGSRESMMHAILQNRFPTDYCLPRAFFVHASNPSKYRIVIGALGFVQTDGRTFWELG